MNFYSIEQLRNRFKYGIEQLAEDEFIGSDGLPYCKKCKNPRYYEHNGEVMRNICDCQEEERRQIRENLKAEQRLFNFNERKKLSLLGERYKNLMFDNAIITEANAKIYDSAKNYVKNADTVYECVQCTVANSYHIAVLRYYRSDITLSEFKKNIRIYCFESFGYIA